MRPGMGGCKRQAGPFRHGQGIHVAADGDGLVLSKVKIGAHGVLPRGQQRAGHFGQRPAQIAAVSGRRQPVSGMRCSARRSSDKVFMDIPPFAALYHARRTIAMRARLWYNIQYR